ncbi:MAG: serine/threonine protein kinase, partial [Nannocystaceae bacterium]
MAQCPYRSVRPLGEGSVGDVHLCVDVPNRRFVVVKWLRAEFNQNSQAARRFRREAERMAGASFLGVIRVNEWGVDDYGRTWMAMEFVDGLPPSAVIPPGDGCSVHRLIRGVSRGLDELHGLGIVHRDLKPDNVLLRSSVDGWEPIIIDLGIAKWLAQDAAATATGSVFGTPYYMSPEQFRDTKHVGPATDRYALAVIAFELLSGGRPFEGRTIPDLLRQHLDSPIPILRVPQVLRAGSLRGDSCDDYVSAPNLDVFMAQAMAKNPSQRYTSSEEMAEAFEIAARADNLYDTTEAEPLFDPIHKPVIEISGE